MQDFQCQLGEFMTIDHFHHTGLLSNPDVHGVPRDIFRDSNSLVLGDFERADAWLLSDSSPSGLALAKLSTLQLSQSKLVLAFRTHFNVVFKFFADIVCLVDQLSRLGSSKEDLCGAILFALSTCVCK